MQKYQQEKVHIYHYSNGLRLVYLNWNSPVAHAGLFIKAGSRNEQEEEQGLAHFIEHTIFKGTTRRSSTAVINCLEQVGGELNAYTGREETVIHASFLSEYSRRALELISDIAFNATFPEKELEKEKEVIIDEINSYLDTPDECIFDDFEEQLFDNQSFGRNILGTPDKVRSFRQEDVRRFIQRNYQPEGMVVGYVGNQRFETVQRMVDQLFTKTTKEIHSPIIHTPPQPAAPFHKTVFKPIFQSHCILGGEAPSVQDDDFWAMTLLNNYLGGPSMNAVLNINLRERNGYTYRNESGYSSFADMGIFEIYCATDPKTMPKCLKIIERTLKKLPEISSTTLQKMQKQLCGQIAVASDSGLNRLLSIGKSVLQTQQVLSTDEVFNKIWSVSPTQLHHVAQTYINFDHLSCLIYHPDEDE